VLFFAEMWERFSFYGMRALLVFYMTKRLGFADNAAYAVYGNYTALVYATPAFGGILADRLLGYRKAVTLGAILMALGHFAMAIDHLQVFYLALALLICGNGFFKPNISTIVGRLYPPGDPRRDGGFTIFYMGVNLGAGLAPLLCGYIGENFGWHYGFGLAGVGMVAGLVTFQIGQRVIGAIAGPPDPERLAARVAPGMSRETLVYAGTVAAVVAAWGLLQSHGAVLILLVSVGILAFGGLIRHMIMRSGAEERDRLWVVLALMLAGVVFWALFEQAGSSINLFTDRNVRREVLGLQIDASLFQSVNPAYILLLGPVFAWIWVRLARGGREPSTPAKFALGVLQLGLGFGALYLGAASADPSGMVALGWLLLGYLLHTTGELCLSPVGLSMVTKLAPAGMTGWVMGCWFLSTAYAQYLAGLIAMLTGTESADAVPAASATVMVYGDVFGKLGILAVAVGALLLVLARPLARRMHGAG
jgi:POT family proton-dependent oligopeptide transporter